MLTKHEQAKYVHKLVKRLKAIGINQIEVAVQLGTHPTTISNWISGRTRIDSNSLAALEAIVASHKPAELPSIPDNYLLGVPTAMLVQELKHRGFNVILS